MATAIRGANNGVGVSQIKAGTISNADIHASAAIALSKLATAVIAANGSQAFTADQSMGGFKLTSLADPTAAGDAVNKAYADSIAAGLDPKASVRVATVTAGTYASSFANGQVVDTVTLVTGDRILIKNQATASQNGIHIVQASGAPVRATDSDGSPTNEVTLGNHTFIEEGSQAGSGWVLYSSDATSPGTQIVPGTDTQLWTQFSASTAVTVSGTTNRITVTGGPNYTVDIAATYVGQTSITTLGTITTGTWNGSTVTVPYGGTGATSLTSNGVLYGNGTGTIQATAAGANRSILTNSAGTPIFTAHIFTTDNAGNSAIYSDATSVFEIRNSTESGGMNVYSSPTTTNSTASGNVAVFSGGTSGTTSNSGTVSMFSGNATGTSGDIDLSTGTGATVGKVRILTANSLRAEFDSTGVNLSGGEAYKIGGTSVLDATTLGSGVVNSSLTSVGTLTSGTWNAATITVPYGGTGVTSFTSNGVLYGNGTSALQVTSAGAANTFLYSNAGTPAFTSNVFVTQSATAAELYSNASSSFAIKSTGAGSNLYAYTANNGSGASGQINIYAGTGTTGSGVVSLATGAVSGSGNTGDIISITGNAASGNSGSITFETGTASGTVGTMTFSPGGTLVAEVQTDGLNLTTGNTYQINNTTVLDATTLGSGVVNSSLTSVGTIGTGVWQGTTIGTTYGGTGLSISPTSINDGDLLIGSNSGDAFVKTTLTAGTGITIVNGAGSITISSTGSFGASNIVTEETPTGAVDGSNVSFTIANTPYVGTVRVYLNGVRQKSGGVDYSISGTTITFVNAPQTGDELFVDYFK